MKKINLEIGASRGDCVLQAVAAGLTAALPPRASIYRIGGNDFATVLPGMGEDEAKAWAEAGRRVAAASIVSAITPEEAARVEPHVESRSSSIPSRATGVLTSSARTTPAPCRTCVEGGCRNRPRLRPHLQRDRRPRRRRLRIGPCTRQEECPAHASQGTTAEKTVPPVARAAAAVPGTALFWASVSR